MSEPSDKPKQRRWKWLAGGAAAFGGLLLLSPQFLSPIVEPMVLGKIEETAGGPATVTDFAFTLFGSVDLEGLTVDDENGLPLARCEELNLEVDVIDAIFGTYVVEVDASGLELHLREEEDGSWKVGKMGGGGEEEGDSTSILESLFAELTLTDAQIVLHGADGTTTLHELRLEAHLDGLEEPARYDFEANVEGPGGERGTLEGEGETRLIELTRADFDPLALVRDTDATLEIGLTEFDATWLDTSGDVKVVLADGATSYTGALAANGGEVKLDGALALTSGEANPVSTLRVDLVDVAANSRLSPLLSLVHPAFSAVESIQEGEIGGVVACELALSYSGPMTLDTLTGGWSALATDAISGEGRFEIRQAALRRAPFFAQLLDSIGVDASAGIDLRPITFSVEAGRIQYGEPWTWTIGGIETTFSGSIGLDRTLEMAWNVPITDGLIERHSFLEVLRGELVSIPISGTVTRPRLAWTDALTELASTAARKELQSRVHLPGLSKGADEAGDLLKEADALWDRGEKVAAAAIYARIRKEYKVSLVYTLNRDRIKKRARYKP